MTCPHCQLEADACACQGSLLPPNPEWRYELQQKVDAYRARRGRRRPEVVTTAPVAAEPEEEAADRRILLFRPPEEGSRRPMILRSTASVVAQPQAEPLADPVVPPPRPRENPPPLAAWEPPPEPVLPPVPLLVPFPQPEAELAEPVARLAEERRSGASSERSRRARVGGSVATDTAAFLQIPLPIASAGTSVDPVAYPVAPRHLRLRAGLADAGVVGAAAALFAFSGWASQGWPAPDLSTLRHLLPALIAVPGALAALYLVACAYAGGRTVGMRRAGLCIRSFEGPLTAAAQRRRAWASLISLAALGLGYAWIFCDAQRLTWHDYISRTFVATAESSS